MILLAVFSGAFLGVSEANCSSPEEIVGRTVLTLLGLLFFTKKKKWGYFLGAFVLFLGIGLLSFPSFDGYGTHRGIVIRNGGDYYLFLSGLRRYYVYEKGQTHEVGDILSLTGNAKDFIRTTYESQFDFGKYLRSLGCTKEISLGEASEVWRCPVRFRAWQKKYLLHFDSNASAVLDSVLFGYSSSTNEWISNASSLDLVYLFSSSGLLYGGCLRAVQTLFSRKVGERAGKFSCVVAACILLPFGIRKIGVWRVFATRVISLCNERAWKKRLSYGEVVCLAGIVLICCSRYSALQSGFKIGFGASLLLYHLGTPLESCKKRRKAIASFLALHLFLLPYLIESNGSIHFLNPFLSVAVAPLMEFVQLLGFLGLLTLPLAFLLNPLCAFLASFLKVLSVIDLEFVTGKPGTWIYYLYYPVLLAILYLYEIGASRIWRGLSFLSAIFTGLSFVPMWNMVSWQVSFINVGQGDSILIRDGCTSVLLDTGGNLSFDMAKETLIPFLRKERVYHLDALIASHGDYDHIGAAESLKEKYKVYKYIDSKDSFPLHVGNLIFENYNVFDLKEENETSLVLSLTLGGTVFLFPGDADVTVEKMILSQEAKGIDCDILKVGHHGSATSTCEEWLDALTPREAVISVGAKNSYGHPSDDVLSRLTRRGIRIRRTDREGTVTYWGVRKV